MRIINNDAFNSHTDPIFAELKLLKVEQIFLLQVASFRFNFEISFSLLSLIITSLLFDKFTSITTGPPIHTIFHFLELILKNSVFFIKDLKFINL